MGSITLQKVSKVFGEAKVIPSIDLEIHDGEFVVFVGPSGCGKSTLLRLIAGLEDVSGGHILIDGKDVTQPCPRRTRPGDGVPVLRALSAYERAQQHRLPA
jgi:multiple sugar transport system ATP-binding protein